MSRDTDIILCAASGLPPVGWLEGATLDQQRHWGTVRSIFQALHTNLKAYFSGETLPLEQIIEKRNRELLERSLKTYTTLYAAIQDDWRYLYPELRRLEDRKKGIKLSTPGECLASILHCDCWSFFEPCLKYSEFSPKKIRKHLSERYKIENLIAKPHEELSQEELRKIKAWVSFEANITGDGNFLRLKIESQLERDAKKLPSVARSLRVYKVECQELTALISSGLHPNQRMRGFKWVRGERLNIS